MRDALAPVLVRSVATPRLVLEPQLALHAAQMFTLLQDPAIYRYENEAPPSVEWLEERFRRLETRVSADGREQWLNWVVRLPGRGLIGFVQATIRNDRCAAIAYVFGSAHWGRGYASEAVKAMLDELAARHDINAFSAVLKRHNAQSVRLLERLGFAHVPTDAARHSAASPQHPLADEILMRRAAVPSAACGNACTRTDGTAAANATEDCVSSGNSL